jgi:hypothetical protein
VSSFMRDIRSDLQERSKAAEEEVRVVAVEYDKRIEELQIERDAKIEKAKAKVELLSKLIEFENEALSKAPSEAPSADPPQLPHLVPPPNERVGPTLAQMIGFRKVG